MLKVRNLTPDRRWVGYVRRWRTPVQAGAVLLMGVPFLTAAVLGWMWLLAAPAWVLPGLWLYWETHHIPDQEDGDG